MIIHIGHHISPTQMMIKVIVLIFGILVNMMVIGMIALVILTRGIFVKRKKVSIVIPQTFTAFLEIDTFPYDENPIP